ncbi:YqaA family protein [Falsirhodobacter halotolerans]|uniref:YqaA family protein n=1 Tax=Falsirhodobacter halotolerans TaxID=1146892 RepID=UPI001FD56D04|nr:YqaA family protein [Falsirhodobacter halotolerans]MCJ8140858.1 DedA family protein [Falsirhodobacter halotolerans]
MLRNIYDWTMRLASKRRADYALGAIAFAESSFFPIPPDALLVPMVLANRRKAARLAFLCTIMSVLGGILGYLIGRFLFEGLALPVLAFYGYTDKFESFAAAYNDWGMWILVAGSLTPFPFKLVTIASGATGLNFTLFVVSSLLARGTRFFLVAGLIYAFGPSARDFIERRLALVFTAGLVALMGGFAVLTFLM